MGIDRFAMLLADEDNIREVIAFPKNQRGVDLMFSAPSAVDTQQLDDLGLQLKPVKSEAVDGDLTATLLWRKRPTQAAGCVDAVPFAKTDRRARLRRHRSSASPTAQIRRRSVADRRATRHLATRRPRRPARQT